MKTLLGAAIASALSALVATAGADGWDGDSWVYDQSGHVAARPSRESGSLAVLDSAFLSLETSTACGVCSRFTSSRSSEPASVCTFQVGMTVIFR